MEASGLRSIFTDVMMEEHMELMYLRLYLTLILEFVKNCQKSLAFNK